MSWKNMPDTGNNWSKVDTTSELITIEEVILNNFKEIQIKFRDKIFK